MTAERWLPVVGYEGWYEVSNLGRVKRVRPGRRTRVGKILKPGRNSSGYGSVCLYVNGVRRSRPVHILAATAFIGPYPAGKEVNHKDGIKANCHIENLEYVTQSENSLHAYALGLHKPCRGEDSGCAKLTEEDVHNVRRRSKEETQRSIAESLGVKRASISKIVTGRSWAWLAEAK